MRRRRHAKRNPTKSQKTMLVVGGLAVVAAVGGYVYWKSKQPAPQLPAAPAAPATTTAPK